MPSQTTTTPGTSSGASQSDPLGVDLSNLNVQGLSGSGSGNGSEGVFDLTAADTNNPEEFGIHPPAQEHQPAQSDQQPLTPAAPVRETQQGGAQAAQAPVEGQPAAAPDIATIIRQALTEAAPGIGAAAVAASQHSAQVQQQEAEQRLSPEELDAKFNVVRLNDEHMTALGFDPANATQRAALEGLLHNTAKMASTIAAFQRDRTLEALKQSLAPIIAHVNTQQTAALKTQFFSQNPELADHEQLLGAVYTQLKQSGFQGTNEEWFGKVAATTKTILDRVRNGTGAASGQPAAGNQPNQPQSRQQTQTQPQNSGSQTTHRMTTLSGGGQGGASTGSGQSQTKSDPTWAVWD